MESIVATLRQLKKNFGSPISPQNPQKKPTAQHSIVNAKTQLCITIRFISLRIRGLKRL